MQRHVGEGGTVGPLLRLALPSLLEQLLVMLVGLVDLWLTGNYLEQRHLAAIGFLSYVLWLLPSIFGVVSVGALALVARFVGAGQMQEARRVVHQSLVLGVGVAAALTLIVAFWSGPLVRVTQLPEEAALLATRYLSLLLPAIFFMMLEQIGIACLRGAGDTVSGFFVMSAVNVVNMIVGATLMFGWGPLPKLGWDGLAIGAASGYLVGGIATVALLACGRAGLRLKAAMFRFDPALMRRVLRIGVPGGCDMIAVVLCHIWFISIINSLGTLQAAAHGLGVRIESLAYLPGTAFQVAAATLAGQYLGAGDERQASRSVVAACLLGGFLMSLAGGVFFFGGEWLTSIFLGSDAEATAELTVPLLRLVALAMPSLALTMVLTGALRGAGDTRFPLACTFLGFLCVRIPLAHYLAWSEIPLPLLGTIKGLGWGVIGAWHAMVADIVVRSILVAIRFQHGGWRRVRV